LWKRTQFERGVSEHENVKKKKAEATTGGGSPADRDQIDAKRIRGDNQTLKKHGGRRDKEKKKPKQKRNSSE